jgi:hypothetical protein
MSETCELCSRIEVETTEHHLTPREEGGSKLPTAMLCIPCHKQIHALYSNKELATRLYSIELLLADDSVYRFVKWIRKQPFSSVYRTKRSNHKKTYN